MMVYLVRHGIAEDVSATGDDESRRLTAQGRGRMQKAAAGLRRMGIRPATVLTSPLVRAAETAAIIAAAFPGLPAPRDFPALAPAVPPMETIAALRVFGRYRELLLVGHQPNLGHVAAVLLTGSPDGLILELKKGACAALELSGFVARAGAVLRWLLPPRALRQLA